MLRLLDTHGETTVVLPKRGEAITFVLIPNRGAIRVLGEEGLAHIFPLVHSYDLRR